MTNLFKIIKSKLSNKDNLGDWYPTRVETCLGCEFLSDNKEKLTVKDNLFKIGNFGKAHCTECGCGVKDKASLKSETCPKGKWLSLDISGNSSKIPVINLSENIGKMSYSITSGQYTLNYGEKKIGQDTKIKLFLDSKDEVLGYLKTVTSCGCTKSEPIKISGGYEIEVSYKSSIGGIKQSVQIQYKNSKGQLKIILINLRGNITR